MGDPGPSKFAKKRRGILPRTFISIVPSVIYISVAIYMNLIVAHDELGGIGKDNKIPWRCPEDLINFRKLTTGSGNNSVIMGRKTWESLNNKKLANRKNIVLSTSLENPESGKFFVANSVDHACRLVKGSDQVWVIGGINVYDSFLENGLIKKMWITHIPGRFNCDRFFSTKHDWEIVAQTEIVKDVWVKELTPRNSKGYQ